MTKHKHENDALKGTMEEWEQAVFDNAAYFRVVAYQVGGEVGSAEYKAFTGALYVAVTTTTQTTRTLLYAISADGRSFCIPPNQWDTYLARWKANQKG